MQHPQQSPIDPADLPPVPVGEVPPVMVAVPNQARRVLADAGLDRGVDVGLVQARFEELADTFRATAAVIERAELTALAAAMERDR